MNPQRRREYDARRRSGVPWRNWYKLKAWLVARAAQLVRQPFCERCLNRGHLTPASVVNHRTPHKGDWALFMDPGNHESSCKPCHDGEIQREEARGFVAGCDEDGRPIDPNHPWNR